MKRWRINNRKELGGFITVEYTCLIGVIFLIYCFLLSVGLFWYNQCILQSNVKMLALEGLHMADYDAEEKTEALQQKEKRLYHEKYLFAEEVSCSRKIIGNYIRITGKGFVGNTLYSMGIGDKRWKLSHSCDVVALQSADTLRMCKHILDLGEDLLPEIEEALKEILDFEVPGEIAQNKGTGGEKP